MESSFAESGRQAHPPGWRDPAGSASDRPHGEKIAQSLRASASPSEVPILGAQEPEASWESCASRAGGGAIAYIRVPGARTRFRNPLLPRWSRDQLPPRTRQPSCLVNPPGSSNAVIYAPGNAEGCGRSVRRAQSADSKRPGLPRREGAGRWNRATAKGDSHGQVKDLLVTEPALRGPRRGGSFVVFRP